MSAMLGVIFRNYSIQKLQKNTAKIVDCLDRLDEEQIWRRFGDEQNSIANLVLHLAGNVRQWIGSGVTGQADIRDRDAEFAAKEGWNKEQLKDKLTQAVEEACAQIQFVTDQDLPKEIHVQVYDMTKLEAIYHVVEHFSGHTFQIIFATKALTGKNLGFYKHLSEGGPAPDTKA
jgi:uncharacterized damage-inducible protein DinB